MFGYTDTASELKNIGLEGGSVKGGGGVGALIGQNYGSVTNCYATLDVCSELGAVGGLIGANNHPAQVTSCYATGDVKSRGSNAGGLVGGAGGFIINCYATGDVSGTNNVGGLLGVGGAAIENCYATGDVSGTDYVGGLKGNGSTSNLINSYATGNVYGEDKVGGLVGAAWDTPTGTNCYSTGKVTGTPDANSITNSADWDGTKFTYDYETTGFSINTDGSNIGSFTLQVGINGDESCRIGFDTNFVYNLGAVKRDIASDNALNAIMNFTDMLSEKSTQLGAVQNRLDSALESITVNMENLTSSLSTIRDADIAEVSSQYIQQQILQQASATLLATANQSPSIALQLI